MAVRKTSASGSQTVLKRKIEIFSGGCITCKQAIRLIKRSACKSCEIIVHDMNRVAIARRAVKFGIRAVPSVVIDGKLSACCSNRGVEIKVLKLAGLGREIRPA